MSNASFNQNNYPHNDVLESLKNEGLRPNKIIISTASIVGNNVEEMLSIGVKAILQKPLSLEHLDETMSRFRHLK